MHEDKNPWDRWAAVYDEFNADQPVEPVIRFIDETAPKGPLLELGVGTGRLAVPLAENDREVHGIDLSSAMIERLRMKGSPQVHAQIADMADFDLGRLFSGVYCMASSFYSLLTQEEQISAFACVERHLEADGVFIVDNFVPSTSLLRPASNLTLRDLDDTGVSISATKADLAAQTIRYQEIRMNAQGISMLPVSQRFCWPSEQDLMARLAGLRLRSRVGGFNGEPYNRKSTRQIAVYERA
jgi:SAM-dependent methyltransferase